jgi:hypothetical protein
LVIMCYDIKSSTCITRTHWGHLGGMSDLNIGVHQRGLLGSSGWRIFLGFEKFL